MALWQKGQSGNPRGRPPARFDLAAEARKFAPLALQTVVGYLSDPDKGLAAAIHLLDRGYGKPKSEFSFDGETPVILEVRWQPAQITVDADTDTAATTDDEQSIDVGAAFEALWRDEKC